MGAIFGGGSAKREQQKAAEASRQAQAVANDRQLSALQADAETTGATRRNPRGRRLFLQDASQKTTLS